MSNVTELHSATFSLDSGDRQQYRYPESTKLNSVSFTAVLTGGERMPEDIFLSSFSMEVRENRTQVRRRKLILSQ
jgi:hypothetical protein